MTSTELLQRLTTPLFFDYQVERLFPDESKHQVNVQLTRLARAGVIVRLKRGLYVYAHAEPNEFVMANLIYRPSYVSLESALNNYGIIPDVVGNVTSVSPVTTKTIKTPRGTYIYSKIATNLYFGFNPVTDPQSHFPYTIAAAEKALLDYVYIRKLRDLSDQRIDLGLIDRNRLIRHGRIFPKWVLEAINEQYHR